MIGLNPNPKDNLITYQDFRAASPGQVFYQSYAGRHFETWTVTGVMFWSAGRWLIRCRHGLYGGRYFSAVDLGTCYHGLPLDSWNIQDSRHQLTEV